MFFAWRSPDCVCIGRLCCTSTFQVLKIDFVEVVSLRLDFKGSRTRKNMTSNTDKNQLNEHADAGQELTENFATPSSDLENILNSLGHAVADNQHKNSENRQENMARARNIESRAGDASLEAGFEDADIFDALDDKISDTSERRDDFDGVDMSGGELPKDAPGVGDRGDCREEGSIEEGSIDVSGETSLDVVAPAVAEEGDLENLADWNQSMADELSRIYSEINGDEPNEFEDASGVAVPSVADLNLDDELSEELEADRVSISSPRDEELLDTEFMAAAMQATDDVAVDDVAIDDVAVADVAAEAVDDVAVDDVAVEDVAAEAVAGQSIPDENSDDAVDENEPEITDELADASALMSAETPVPADNWLADVALKIEDALDSKNDSDALKLIEMRFDHIEEKLNAVIEYPETDAGLFALEAQMNDLKEQFQQVEAQLSGIVGIEENVNALIDEVKNSNGEIKTVVAGIAGAVVGGLSNDGAGENDRMAEVGDILDNYIKERRDTDRYAAGAFSDIQTGLDEIADYLIANDPALSGHAQSEQSAVVSASDTELAGLDDSVGRAAIAENDAAIEELSYNDSSSSGAENECAAATVVSAHGDAQEALGLAVSAREDIAGQLDDEDVPSGIGSELCLDEISTDAEIGVAVELDAQNPAGSTLEELDINEDAELLGEDVLLEIAPHVEEVAEAAVVLEQAVEGGPASPQIQAKVEANSHKTDARMAEEAARREAAQIPVRANEAERAGNFLASARKAAIVAAAQAEADRADEVSKQGKKKRSLFSFKLGGASPVLVIATTILTATTAGLVYSQIKDGSHLNQIAHSSSSTPRVSAPREEFKFSNINKVDKASNIGNGNMVSEKRSVIDEVPHHRSADTAGVDVPVGIIVEEPRSKPDLKQLANLKRRQLLARMSSDLTGGAPAVGVTKIAFAPESDPGVSTPSVAKNIGPTLALPPATIGPFSLRVAAAKGDAGSQFDVATRYAQGRGVKRDFKLAAKWYGRAAAQGHAIAQYRLAALYEKGSGVGRDSSRAQTWYRRSAEKGNVKAMHNFAVLHTGRGGKAADYTTAAQWFKSAAEHGLADSQYNLAILYANGLGVKRSKVEAYKWFALASARGDGEAGKRQVELKGLMSVTEVKAAKKLLATWRKKPAEKSANAPHQAAQLLKKSNVTVDQQKLRLVMQAQRMLGKLGYSVGAADGRMGPKTRDAIRNFQRRSGMKITGDVSQTLVSRLSGLTG